MTSSPILRRLPQLPYPIASTGRSYALTYENEDKRLARSIRLIQGISFTLSALALAWCRENGITNSGTALWEQNLPKGAAVGVANHVIGATRKDMRKHPDDPIAQILGTTFTAAHPRLEGFTPKRNALFHGAFPERISDLYEDVDHFNNLVNILILDDLNPLTGIQLAKIRPRKGRSSTTKGNTAELLSGASIPFENRIILHGQQLYEEGTVVLTHPGRPEVIDLTPYLIWRVCTKCGDEELFYLTRRHRGRDEFLSFTTGHLYTTSELTTSHKAQTTGSFGMEPRGARSLANSSGSSSAWRGLAPRGRRILARSVDTAILAIVTAVVILAFSRFVDWWLWLVLAYLTALSYEFFASSNGSSPGKRLLRIQVISIREQRPIGRADSIRRALFVDLQILFPPLVLKNLAWLLFDPARQCLHDRRSETVVLLGSSSLHQRI